MLVNKAGYFSFILTYSVNASNMKAKCTQIYIFKIFEFLGLILTIG